MKKLHYLLLASLFLIALSCQTVSRVLNPAPATAMPSFFTPTAQPTFTPTLSPTPLSTLTPSPDPTPSQSPTSTIVITPSALQLEVFEQLWQSVKEDYLYSDFNGLDWDAIHAEYRQRVLVGLSDADFYLAMDEMISRLGDDHSVYLSPEEVAIEDAEYAGKNDYVGVGVLISAVPERKRAVILVVFPNSPAAQAGLKSRDNILAADGQSILDENGLLRDIVRGPEGSEVTLTVQSPGDEPREITITRRRITGAVPTPYQSLETPSGQRIGYILLVTLNDVTVDDQFASALESMAKDAPLDGLIIDNRQNSGGADTVLRGILSYFTDGTLGHFLSRQGRRPLRVDSIDISGSQRIPLVVLIGIDTVSYGEVFSGVLKDLGRAYLIGETTEGNVETLWAYDFPDGSRAWLAHESFRPLNESDQNWEETGVIPDQEVILNWDEVSLEDDAAIQAALEYFEQE